ncbi:hypothetical protein [Cryptosporangium minutisporangium]|uniref:Uncharacterized protein n=1 Tax=Cryptosporangium minutisporangium TaxID=113569 RepID=A0ABP6SQD7_9ACTN
MTPVKSLTVTDRTADSAVTRATTGASAPVFVDTTGRRARWLRVLAVVVCLAFALYLGTMASGVFGSSVDLSTAMPSASATASATASAAAG